MKAFSIFIVGLLWFHPAFADTVDYYRIYINRAMVRDVSPARPSHLNLKGRDIKTGDSLSVTYFRDTHCGNCSVNLLVCDSTGRVLLKATAAGIGTMLSLSLSTLISDAEKARGPYLVLYYDDRHINGLRKPTLLLTIHLE